MRHWALVLLPLAGLAASVSLASAQPASGPASSEKVKGPWAGATVGTIVKVKTTGKMGAPALERPKSRRPTPIPYESSPLKRSRARK